MTLSGSSIGASICIVNGVCSGAFAPNVANQCRERLRAGKFAQTEIVENSLNFFWIIPSISVIIHNEESL